MSCLIHLQSNTINQPRVLFGDLNIDDGSCGPDSPACKCSWTKPTEKSCNYHSEHNGLIWRVHRAAAEIYPSIGGWTLSDPFPAMAKNPTSRAAFVANCIGLIKDYDFDGIDIDWEYPGYAGENTFLSFDLPLFLSIKKICGYSNVLNFF